VASALCHAFRALQLLLFWVAVPALGRSSSRESRRGLGEGHSGVMKERSEVETLARPHPAEGRAVDDLWDLWITPEGRSGPPGRLFAAAVGSAYMARPEAGGKRFSIHFSTTYGTSVP